MPRTLDRSRKFGTTYGDTNLRFLQDGVYFDGQGREVVGSEVLTPAEAAPPEPAAQAPAPAGDGYRGRLKAMAHAKVKQIYLSRGGDPALTTGAGSQARMIEWLLTQEQAQSASTGGT
jgi:hypothetical protein